MSPDYRVALGYLYAFTVLILGGAFIWFGWFEPSMPFLPEGKSTDALILFVTGAMGGSMQWVFSTATASLTARSQARATHAALYATPPEDQPKP